MNYIGRKLTFLTQNKIGEGIEKYKYSDRIIAFDHLHRHSTDKGIPYEFQNAYQLMQDFFNKVDEILKQQVS